MTRLPFDAALRRWLTSDGSLSRRLARTYGNFHVQRLCQHNAPARPDEWLRLGLSGARRAHVREVVLWGDGQGLIYARSVLGARHVRRTWRALLGLGQRPLADLLFGPHAAKRTPLSYQLIAPVGPGAAALRKQWRCATGQAWPARVGWARSSVFRRRGLPLLVTEVFSPDVTARPSR